MKAPCVYMLASRKNGTLYIGVTSDLIKRNWQHREGIVEGFTKKYDVKMLVWYELHETMNSALRREKAMKKWLRAWKIELIEKFNPEWTDLWPAITGEVPQAVIPAKAGIHKTDTPMDSRVRGNDGTGGNDESGGESPVIPAKAGIHMTGTPMDSRVRGNDGTGGNDDNAESAEVLANIKALLK